MPTWKWRRKGDTAYLLKDGRVLCGLSREALVRAAAAADSWETDIPYAKGLDLFKEAGDEVAQPQA